MNKQAAEKIATEYYTLGVQLALHQSGLVKQAGLPKEIVKKLIQAPTAGAAGFGGYELLARSARNPTFKNAWKELPEDLAASLVFGITGAGGMAAAHLAGKGVDKTHNLLSKLRK